MKIFLTGASGGVGTETTFELSQKGHEVFALIHRKKELIRYNRKKIIMEEKPLKESKPSDVIALKGDISKKKLGLSDEIYTEIQDSVDLIIHLAARVEFGREDEYYTPVNVDGTRHVLELANSGKRKIPLLYVSTAYISGETTGLFKESQFDVNQHFTVSYEKSKFKAETLVREALDINNQIVILRPSIVVGAAKNGATRAFKTIYPILRVFCGGMVRSLPGEYNALLNLIPVDYVSNSIVQLAENMSKFYGRTFHIVNDKSITTRDLSNILAEYPSFYVPRYISPVKFNIDSLEKQERRYYELVVYPYISYFKRRVEFSNEELKKAIDMPKNIDGITILRRVLNYCLKIGYVGRPAEITLDDYRDMANDEKFNKIKEGE